MLPSGRTSQAVSHIGTRLKQPRYLSSDDGWLELSVPTANQRNAITRCAGDVVVAEVCLGSSLSGPSLTLSPQGFLVAYINRGRDGRQRRIQDQMSSGQNAPFYASRTKCPLFTCSRTKCPVLCLAFKMPWRSHVVYISPFVKITCCRKQHYIDEIVIMDGKKKCLASQPPPLSDISRTSTIKIRGVTISNKLSVSDHITNIISKCSQTLYALTILRAHGSCDTALQSVYRSVVVASLLYPRNAWWGFTTSAVRRLAGLVRRGVRRELCSPDLINIDNLVSDMDDKLSYSILKNKHHIVHQALPPERSGSGYTLRWRRHELSLTKNTRLNEQNFIYIFIYENTYWTDFNFYCFLNAIIVFIYMHVMF